MRQGHLCPRHRPRPRRLLGTRGHVSALRRTSVGPFLEEDLIDVEELTARAEAGDPALFEALDGVEVALEELFQLNVVPADAHRLRCGQSIILRGRDAPVLDGHVAVNCQGALIAIGDASEGEVRPHRVFNWARSQPRAMKRSAEPPLYTRRDIARPQGRRFAFEPAGSFRIVYKSVMPVSV